MIGDKHIVGRKTETYLTAEQRDYGGHWEVTKHTIVNELHATKGWRTIMRHQQTQKRKRPPFTSEREAHTTSRFERAMPRKEPKYPEINIPEAMLMRHGWYRRKVRNELTREIMLEAAQ